MTGYPVIGMQRLHSGRALAAVAMLAAAPAFADWDVTDTGQPYTDAKFTVTEGTWMSLDISPDGKTVVFDLLGDIYSIPAGGGTATLIHGGAAMEYMPRFSPDGSRLLYVSDKDGGYDVWVSTTDGSDARAVTAGTSGKFGAPTWSADGRYAAASKDGEIWLYHLDGGRGRLLVAGKDGKPVQEPRFSHDGRYLYYTENIYAGSYRIAIQPMYAIKRRELSTGRIDEVLSGFGSATTAQLSPDDKRIAFIRRVKDKTVLFVYDLQTGQQRPIYDGLDRDMYANYTLSGSYYPLFDWFPDGRHVAIWSKGKIYKIDMDARTRQEIAFRANVEQRITVPPRFENPLAPERFTVRAIQQVATAPDGRSITFNALGHLWQKRLPDGKPERLTKAAEFEFEPSYSNDGAHIGYVAWDDERGSALKIITANGRPVKTLVKSMGIVRQPAFSPDGKRLVYWLEQGNKKMGGYRATQAGFYWIALAEGVPHYIGASEGFSTSIAESSNKRPQFSPDGERIYFAAKQTVSIGLVSGNSLESLRLDGTDRRRHVVSDETGEFRISPDLKWLAYKKDQQYYLMPYRETGTPYKLTKAAAEVPITQLSEYGGFELAWLPDSSRLSWILGKTYFTAPVAGRTSAAAKPAITKTDIGLDVATDKPQGTIAFTNGRVITLRGEEKSGTSDEDVIERATVVVSGNRIAEVGSADRVRIPQGAKVIDVSGKTLMPGLVDMHGHIDTLDETLLMPQKHPGHYAALAYGVTTNFNPSTTEQSSFARAEMNMAGVSVGPRYISTGRHISGAETPGLIGMFYRVDDLDDARKIIGGKKAMGAIIVKSYNQPKRSQRQQLIKAAREAQLMVTPENGGNFYDNLTMILDGHASIEHNIPLAGYYGDLVQLLVHGGTSLTPTIVVTLGESFAENYFFQTTRPWDDPKVKAYVQTTSSWYNPLGGAPDAPPYVRGMVSLHQADELWDIGFRAVARTMKKVDDAGGIVTTGAHGNIQGPDIHWEMWALGEGGMSPYRILRAATINGAKTIGLDKQIGTLEAGKLADLIVLDANPLESIRNTNTVRYTMVNGRLYDSLSMNEVGNYHRPRTKFYWELEDYKGIDWNEAWGGPGVHAESNQ